MKRIRKGMNPRYVNYARAHGKSPAAMLAADKITWPGGCMCGFLLWNSARLAEFRKLRPDCFLDSTLVLHAPYDDWLRQWVNCKLREVSDV